MEKYTRNPESREPRGRDNNHSWDREAWGWDNGAYWEPAQREPAPRPYDPNGLTPTRQDGENAIRLGDQIPTVPGSRSIPSDWETGAGTIEGPRSPGTNWKGLVYEVAETLILTFLIFILMRALVQNYRIEGYSMKPTLEEGQRLFVSKVSYYFGEPQRGDIIVFEYPNSKPGDPEKDYIKRIIGTPGDTVECRPGEIVVNGQVLDERYNPNPNSYSCAPTTLGPNEYFVLGDNRNQSSDSHAWGPLERKYIVGKAWLMYWPLKDMGFVPNYTLEAPEPQSLVRTP